MDMETLNVFARAQGLAALKTTDVIFPLFLLQRTPTFLQVVYSDVYMLDDEMKWKVLPPMPKPNSHIEFAWAIVNHSIIIAGGTTEKHPVTKKMVLNGELVQFNLDTLVNLFPLDCTSFQT